MCAIHRNIFDEKESKSMKRYIVPIFAFIFAVTFLFGCGNKPSETSSIQPSENVSVDEMAKVLDNLFDKDQSIIVQMLGEPDVKSDPTQEENDIWAHLIWTYNDECITVEFVDRGNGYVVSRATATTGCTWGTDRGIFIGATEDQVRSAYGDMINEDYSMMESRSIVVGQPSDCIIFNFTDEAVSSVMVGEMG